MILKGILFGLIFLFFVSSVFAVGISPPKSIVYFEPNIVEKIDFFVVNMGDEDSRIKIFFEGELSNLVLWEDQTIDLKSGEKKDFSFLLTMPSSFDAPGDYRINLIAQEIPIEEESGGTYIGAVTSVTSPVYIRVPFEGPYLGVKLVTDPSSVGQIVKSTVFLENLGSISLNNLQGKIDIVSSGGEIVKEITFTESLGLNEFKEIELFWDSTGMESGIYTGKLLISYNGKTAESEPKFKMGDVFIKILDFQKELVTGKINNYFIKMESYWNDVIKDVYVTLIINVAGEEYNFKSISFDLEAWEEKEINMYIALEEGISKLPEGEYDATIGIFYEELSNSEDFILKIKSDTNYLIIFGVVFIVILCILFGLYIFKNKKNGKKLNG